MLIKSVEDKKRMKEEERRAYGDKAELRHTEAEDLRHKLEQRLLSSRLRSNFTIPLPKTKVR